MGLKRVSIIIAPDVTPVSRLSEPSSEVTAQPETGDGGLRSHEHAIPYEALAEKSQPKAQSELRAKGFRFAIVASRWNDKIVSRLIDGVHDALTELHADANSTEVFRVPGAFEIPLCGQKAAESGRFDAVICLGVIIRGDTPHFDYIAASATRGIGEAGLRTGVPLLFGVITADNIEQAEARSHNDKNNKGYEAAVAAVEVANLYKHSFHSG